MPRVRDNPDLIRAIEMCAGGVSARKAWEDCGQPNGEPGIQNNRKAGKALAVARAQPQEPTPEPELEEAVVAAEPAKGPGKGHPCAGFRLPSAQVAKQLEAKEAAEKEYAALYMEATAYWRDLVSRGATGKG